MAAYHPWPRFYLFAPFDGLKSDLAGLRRAEKQGGEKDAERVPAAENDAGYGDETAARNHVLNKSTELSR